MAVDGEFDLIQGSNNQLVKKVALMKDIDVIEGTWGAKEGMPDAKVLAGYVL